MLGSDQKIRFTQNETGLDIKKPAKMPAWQVIGFRIEFRSAK
jgi:hypothetical protein